MTVHAPASPQAKACVIVPTLNEARHIEPLLRQLLLQAPERVAEIIVADGGSTDGTRELVRNVAAEAPRVRLLHNPGRIQAAGVNLAARSAAPEVEVLIRVDAHGAYPPDYIPGLLGALETSGADSVVVRLLTVGEGCFQRAVAAASNGFTGTGGSVHRMGGASRFVDHGHHAAFRRAAFEAAGGYDEAFRANEDAELDVRLRAQGGRIWFAGELVVEYHPRATVRGLALQYFRYGRGRAANVLKHWSGLRLRQCAPPTLVVVLAAALIAAPAAPIALLAPALYLAPLTVAAAANAVRVRSWCALGAAVAAATMHLSWGTGFLLQLATAVRPRRPAPKAWAAAQTGRSQ